VDYVVLIIYHQSSSSKSEYRSAWEELLKAHIPSVPRQDPGQTSTTEPVIQPQTQVTPIRSNSFPSSMLLQHPQQTDQKFHAHDTLQSRKAQPPAQIASRGTHGSQGTFRKVNRARPVIPVSRPGPSASLLQMGGGINSVDVTASTFSFRAPDRTSSSVHRALQGGHNLHAISTGCPPDPRDSAPSAQPSAQMNRASARPST